MLYSWLLTLQGGYYLLTGVWPLVHMPSFVRVTGPKNDYWLVKMVGALAAAVGLALLAALRSPLQSSTAVLAIGSAFAFLAIDVVYVSKKVIGPVCLLDAVPELLLIGGWVLVFVRGELS